MFFSDFLSEIKKKTFKKLCIKLLFKAGQHSNAKTSIEKDDFGVPPQGVDQIE